MTEADKQHEHDLDMRADAPKPDMEIKVILIIDGSDVMRTYRAADITEIEWDAEMESMADTILNPDTI